MPILKNRPPKYQRSGKYAVVYHHGKRIYLGDYGSPESQVAYSRFVAESQADPTFYLSKAETNITVRELAAGYLDCAKATQSDTDYKNCCTVVLDFLLKLYGDDTPVDSFKPSHLKLVRESMIQSRRFCRNTINKYTRRVVSIFAWGVENDLASAPTWQALKTVKALPKGYPGTFDHPEREAVPEWVIAATLPFRNRSRYLKNTGFFRYLKYANCPFVRQIFKFRQMNGQFAQFRQAKSRCFVKPVNGYAVSCSCGCRIGSGSIPNRLPSVRNSCYASRGERTA